MATPAPLPPPKTPVPTTGPKASELPPPGPSNIIVLTPNPLPPPRDVKSQ